LEFLAIGLMVVAWLWLHTRKEIYSPELDEDLDDEDDDEPPDPDGGEPIPESLDEKLAA